MKRNSHAFTIVELLVVIVVIAILAAITIVSYTGISQRAIASVLQSDLDNASKVLKMYYTDNGSYPTSLNSNCPVPTDTRYCLKPSPGNTFTYTYTPTSTYKFKLVATKDSTSYYTTGDTSPTVGGKNLLTDENASFEGGTVGNWGNSYNSVISIDATQGWHGTHSLKIVRGTISDVQHVVNYVSGITSASTQYTFSAKFKGVIGKTYRLRMSSSDGTMIDSSNITANGAWQTISATGTFGNGAIRILWIRGNDTTAGTISYWDAIQLETGSVATPF